MFMFLSRCFGEDTCITIPDIDGVVMVLQPSEPRITISGAERLTRPESDFGAAGGLALFQDLHIISTVTRADAAARHTGEIWTLICPPRPLNTDKGAAASAAKVKVMTRN